jgi:hypothetical protein
MRLPISRELPVVFSLAAMSAMILPAALWQGIVMRKKVRFSSVTTMARGDP